MTTPQTDAGALTASARVLPRLYRDSVALMSIASATERRDGIDRAGAVMGTAANLELLQESGMLPDDLVAGPDDLVIVVRGADADAVEAALDAAEASLEATETTGERTERRPATIAEGVQAAENATVATVSVPGLYAGVVAEQALRQGLHVMCFSDNVPVAQEVRLKQLAAERRLLLMGPDCGTAMLDGVPLGFANAVRPGKVGMVAASGTGAQEVSCLLDRAGAGVTQLIGVGGRDLSADVGGAMTLLALDYLAADPDVAVITVVSKPPAAEVAEVVLARLREIAAAGTPVVAGFLGMADSDGDVPVRGTLEGTALTAAELAGHAWQVGTEPAVPAASGRVLGLFTGGTLASEARHLLQQAGVDAEVLDLGDDQYTAGKPHPMIDPAARAEKIAAAGQDPDVGILLVDVVLGYGSSPDPATPVAEAVRAARQDAEAAGRQLPVVASVCGTDQDPQGREAQIQILRGAGVVVAPTNAAATRAVITAVKGASA